MNLQFLNIFFIPDNVKKITFLLHPGIFIVQQSLA